MTAWLLLGGAIVAEVTATTALTYSNGLSRHAVTAVTVVLYVVAYICLARALKAGMEISVAYAVWSGVGTAALTLIGAALFGESVTPMKIAAIVLIISGVTLLHLTGRQTPPTAPTVAAQAAPASSTHDSIPPAVTAAPADRRTSS